MPEADRETRITTAHEATKRLLYLVRDLLTVARNGTWWGIGTIDPSSQPEFTRQHLKALDAEYGFCCGAPGNRPLIEAALPIFACAGEPVRVVGVTGRCMHEAVLNLACQVLKTVMGTLGAALLEEVPANTSARAAEWSDVLALWPRVAEALRAFPDEDWEMVDATLLHEHDNVIRQLLEGEGKVNEKESPPPPATTVVEVDLATNIVTIQGSKKQFAVKPHQAQMLQGLVKAKHDERQYMHGSDLLELPGCRGKNVAREIANLVQAIPPLKKLLKSDRHLGYWLNG